MTSKYQDMKKDEMPICVQVKSVCMAGQLRFKASKGGFIGVNNSFVLMFAIYSSVGDALNRFDITEA